MNTGRALFYSTLSGLLLALSWPGTGTPLLLFIAWVPLLIMEEGLLRQGASKAKDNWRFIGISSVSFLVWNVGATFWVVFSTVEGGIMALLFSTLQMTLVFFIFHLVKRKAGKWIGNIALIVFWLAYEYFQHRWDLSWPWLTLGNAFAGTPNLIQWYEYTGTGGGTLWVLLCNLLLLQVIRTCFPDKFSFVGFRIDNNGMKIWIGAAVMIALPLLVSFLLADINRLLTNLTKVRQPSLVAIQPNFDPYLVKFDLDAEAQMDTFLNMAKRNLSPGTNYLLLPETAISDGIYEDRFLDSYCIWKLTEFAKSHPGLKIITGATTWKQFKSWETPPVSARKYGNTFYEGYNSAIYIDSSGVLEVYHKSKLVPFVEALPYPALFGPLKELAIDLGGTSGTLGKQEKREVFFDSNSSIGVAPVICYESIYGEYMAGYIQNGANAIFILTNDGWWGDTPGYKQHLAFAKLRAIEYRLPVIRCTNTGISCFINSSGEIEQQTGWWSQETMKGYFKPSVSQTFYASHGDYIGRAACCLFPLLLILPLIRRKNG